MHASRVTWRTAQRAAIHRFLLLQFCSSPPGLWRTGWGVVSTLQESLHARHVHTNVRDTSGGKSMRGTWCTCIHTSLCAQEKMGKTQTGSAVLQESLLVFPHLFHLFPKLAQVEHLKVHQRFQSQEQPETREALLRIAPNLLWIHEHHLRTLPLCTDVCFGKRIIC